MPAPPTSLTRRHALLAAAVGTAGVIAACGRPSDGPDPISTTATPADAGGALTEEAIGTEDLLIARYEAALTAFDGSRATAVMAVILDNHRRHRAALDPSGGAVAAVSPSPLPPTGIRETLADLIVLERQAARSHIAECVASADRDRARLLCFIASADAAHVPALRAVSAP